MKNSRFSKDKSFFNDWDGNIWRKHLYKRVISGSQHEKRSELADFSGFYWKFLENEFSGSANRGFYLFRDSKKFCKVSAELGELEGKARNLANICSPVGKTKTSKSIKTKCSEKNKQGMANWRRKKKRDSRKKCNDDMEVVRWHVIRKVPIKMHEHAKWLFFPHTANICEFLMLKKFLGEISYFLIFFWR